jgi:ubiquinone/menaquinone biosynthesis C-methylase UbiE
MSDAVNRPGSGASEEESHHHHKGKSSERFLNKEVILEALNIQPGQTILDAGCGNGYMAKIFSQKVTPAGKVYALDPDEEALATLRKETQGTNIEALTGDITQLTPIKPSSVDLMYLSTVVHGFSKQKMKALSEEAQRLLKPGAILAIVEIDKKETPFGPPLNIRFSPEELQEIVPFAPLKTIQVGEYFYLQLFQNKAKQEH